MTDPTIYDLIREEAENHAELSDESVAILVLKRLKVPASTSIVLTPVVSTAVEMVRRQPVRNAERSAFKKITNALGSAVDVVAMRAALADETFALGDGRRVKWGEATVEQHAERIVMLEKLVAGTQRTIEQHRDAVEMIEVAGVACLNEIEVAA